MIGEAYGLSGERDKAEQILNKLLKQKKDEYVPAMSIACIYLGLGENDKVFEWLENAYDERFPWLPFYITYDKFSPLWEHISKDPRFKTLLKKMNLPEA